ncbi:MAG TPA: RHS repeat-associated core domain-containing protein [Caldisericia bacterium]|nr:RHS repeat-associated core domain-containing protein [Caldisericia bacterium]HPQ93934.1 RHS repeat-associated core domain-containing protein [Caldisericia bacterium]
MNYKNNTYFYIINIRGDVEAILDINGNEVASYSYDVWGVPTVTNTGGLPNPFLYQGAYGNIWDSEIELYYMNARHYDPSIGRFITQDREHGTLTNTMSQNLYIYCYNNPYGYKDPSGNTADLHEPIANGHPQNQFLSEEMWDMYKEVKEVDPEITIDKFLKLWYEGKDIAQNMQNYNNVNFDTGGPINVDEETLNMHIAFWTCYWNDKASLGLDTTGKTELANYIKGITYIESKAGTMVGTEEQKKKLLSDGIMQVELDTLEDAKDYGYVSQDFFDNWGNKLGHSLDAGLFAGIAVFMACLSKNLRDDGWTWTTFDEFKTFANDKLNASGNLAFFAQGAHTYAGPNGFVANYLGIDQDTMNSLSDKFIQANYDLYMNTNPYGNQIANLVRNGSYNEKADGSKPVIP